MLLLLVSILWVLLPLYVWYNRFYRYSQIVSQTHSSDFYKDKHVLITGATSGIGEGLVYRYAKGGAKIVITARRENELQRVKDTCQTKYGNNQVSIAVCDLAKEEDCERLIRESLQFLEQRIDVIVLNAGMGSLLRFRDIKDLSGHHQVMDVNFWGCVNTTFYALPHLKKQEKGAKIVVVSSVLGKTGTVFRTAYAASKHALHGFYDSLRVEFVNEQVPIQVQILCPGFVKTNIHVAALGSTKQNLKRDLSRFMSVEECVDRMLVAMEGNQFEVFLDTLGLMAAYVTPFMPQFLSDRIRIRAALKAVSTDTN